jgi:hypothetical protein
MLVKLLSIELYTNLFSGPQIISCLWTDARKGTTDAPHAHKMCYDTHSFLSTFLFFPEDSEILV